MKMWDEFKEFAFKGNVMDMAIGVMIGGAFGSIVTSVVNDMLMPLVSVVTGGVSFSHLGFKLGEGEDPGRHQFLHYRRVYLHLRQGHQQAEEARGGARSGPHLPLLLW